MSSKKVLRKANSETEEGRTVIKVKKMLHCTRSIDLSIDNVKSQTCQKSIGLCTRRPMLFFSSLELHILPLDPMFGNMINTLRDSFSTRPTLLISQHAFASAKGKVSQEEKPQCKTDKLSCG